MTQIERATTEIGAIPFDSWPSREVQGIACELVECLAHDYDSHARLTALISAQVRLSKAISDACCAERASLQSSACRAVYYATGQTLLGEADLAAHLRAVGDALEGKVICARPATAPTAPTAS